MGPREHPPRPPTPKLDIDELVRGVTSEMEEIFGRYCMTPADAHEILAETLLTLRVREREIREPRGWLLAALEDRCRRHAEEEPHPPEESN